MSPGIELHAVATQQRCCTSGSGARGPILSAALSAAAPIARILASEDNPDIQRIYRRLLPDHGFELISVPGGDGALTFELALRTAPQLVISDINKPTMNGHALVAALRAHPRTAHIPVLMVTAMDFGAEPQQPAPTPANDYIVKPFPFEDLLYRIVAMIDLGDLAHGELVARAVGLPCYAPRHPITGLPCLHEMATELPIRSARPGWAALEVSLANTGELMRAYGRSGLEGIAGRLGANTRRLAGPGLFVGHTGFDLALTIIGPADLVEQAEWRIHEHAVGLARPRVSQPDAPAPQVALRHADESDGLHLSLLALRRALRR
jgi:CheY-like chemotaxis protein